MSSPSLLRDIGQLFNNPFKSDVLIEVGENDKKEVFNAHSAILVIRSPYFKSVLSSVNGIFVLTKPKNSPKVFSKILKYIYTDEISLKENDIHDILLELLLVADELALLQLVEYLEEYIITYEMDWIQENLTNISSTASKYQKFKRLYEIITDNSSPHPSFPQKVLDSVLINKKHLALLSSWIDSTDNNEINFNLSKNAYEFKLLIRGSRDGMGLKEFHKRCMDKGPTLVIIEVKGTNQIVGGFNPKSWSFKSYSEYLEDAFTFSLDDGKHYGNTILSRAKYGEYSISNGTRFTNIGFNGLKNFDICYYDNNGYEKPIMDNHRYEAGNYEVFQVIKGSKICETNNDDDDERSSLDETNDDDDERSSLDETNNNDDEKSWELL